LRGGIVDLWAPGTASPIRLDFSAIRWKRSARSMREPAHHRQQPRLDLVPASEAILTEETISRFRQNYRAAFGAVTGGDPLYEAVSDGRRFAGMEHWLPFFYERLETLFDYLSGAPVILDHLVEETIGDRLDQVRDHYEARREAASMGAASGSAPYKPIQPDALYLSKESWRSLLADIRHAQLSPFAQPEGAGQAIDMGGRSGRTFAAERTAGDVNVFDALVEHLASLRKSGRKVMLASWSEGARDRLGQVLVDHGLTAVKPVESYADLLALRRARPASPCCRSNPASRRRTSPSSATRTCWATGWCAAAKKRKRAADALTEASSLAAGDLVVHVDHGIGRFVGLKTINAAGAPHDCLELVYAGNDRLFLPVENIELLTRYGAEGSRPISTGSAASAGRTARRG
jgi:transcription-repair coupling factor (superfamily II helicase)